MKIIIAALIMAFLFCQLPLVFASYPEFFGASFTTTAIGNQSTLDQMILVIIITLRPY